MTTGRLAGQTTAALIEDYDPCHLGLSDPEPGPAISAVGSTETAKCVTPRAQQQQWRRYTLLIRFRHLGRTGSSTAKFVPCCRVLDDYRGL